MRQAEIYLEMGYFSLLKDSGEGIWLFLRYEYNKNARM